MRKILTALTLFIILMIIGCGTSEVDSSPTYYRNEMPKMNVVVNGETFETATGGYCWSSQNHSVCADASGDPFDYVEYAPPIQVKPGELMELKFKEDPDSFTINMAPIEDGKLPTTDKTFNAPAEESMVGYSVFTKWENGDITYHFVLDVQP